MYVNGNGGRIHVCSCVCVCVYTCGRRSVLAVFTDDFVPHFWRKGLSGNIEFTGSARLARDLPVSAGVTDTCSHTGFYMYAGDLNTAPHEPSF